MALLAATSSAFAGSAVIACTPALPGGASAGSQSPDHLIDPAHVDLSSVPLTPGPARVSVPVDGQGPRELALWLPDGAGPHPLAIFLHGAGGGGRLIGGGGMLTCLVEPALRPLHPIILAPLSPSRGQWWKEPDIAFVLGVIDAARRQWPIAPSQTVVLGYSNGGIGTWFFARQYPDRFSAAIPMAANDTIIGPTPVPVFAISGQRDELFPIQHVRRAISAAKASGQNITFLEKYRGSHFTACKYTPELEAASRWLATLWNDPTRGQSAAE